MPVPGARYRDAHSGMSGPNAAMRRYMQAVRIHTGHGMSVYWDVRMIWAIFPNI
jgi:hypothetical protein